MNTLNTLRFCKIRNVRDPQRAHSTDAGIDFFVPKFTLNDNAIKSFPLEGWTAEWDGTSLKAICILPGTSILIPLGVKVKVPDGHAMIFFNKSGIAAKKSLVLGSCVVDSDFQGEVLLNLHNITNETQTVTPDEKIAQGVLLKLNMALPEAVGSVEELYPEKTERGEGGFGSTN